MVHRIYCSMLLESTSKGKHTPLNNISSNMQHQELQMSFHFWLCINTLLNSKLCNLTHYYLLAGILWLFNNIYFSNCYWKIVIILHFPISLYYCLHFLRLALVLLIISCCTVLYVYLMLYFSRKYVSILHCKVILTAVDRKHINISNIK